MEKRKNKFSENSIIVLLITALAISQIMTFFRLHEQDKMIDELVRSNTVLFELCRLQTELYNLDLLEKE